MLQTCLPPSPPGRSRRIAYYGPVALTYDCTESAREGEEDRDLLDIAFVPNDWTDGWPKVKNPDRLLHQALEALQAALHITTDELLDAAPRRENA